MLLKTRFKAAAAGYTALQLALKSLPVGFKPSGPEKLRLQATQRLQRLDA